MAHLSLYRKYRSQTFAEVVGQEHVTRTLTNAILEDRIAHAYLFSGPRGTGKTSTARILAKALNCEKGAAGRGGEPCNECGSCREVTNGTSLDVVEIDAASHGSVDDARELREKVAYAPVAGRRKVYIIDECHMLSPAANNALLKVLEEPPEHVVFVFATTEPHKVLQTLLDRCQRYEFRAIDSDLLAEHIARVAEAEGAAIDEEAVSVIVGRATGSARDALSLLEQLLSFAGPKVGFEDVTRLLGSTPEDLLFEAVDLISERDAGAMLGFSDRLIRSSRDIREFMRNLIDHLRALFLVQHATAAQEILDVSDDQLERLRAQSNRFDHAELLRLLDLANATQLALREAVESRLALEIGMARMTRPDLHSTPPSLLSRIERLERVAGIENTVPAGSSGAAVRDRIRPPEEATRGKQAGRSGPGRAGGASRSSEGETPAKTLPMAPSPGRAPEGVPREETKERPTTHDLDADPRLLDIERIRRAWDVVLQKVKRRKISFQALLLPARPAAWQGDELVLEFPSRNRFHRDHVSDIGNQAPLVEAFFETFGVRPRIRCLLMEDGGLPAAREDAAAGAEGAGGGENPGTIEAGRGGENATDPVDLVREGFGAEVVEEI